MQGYELCRHHYCAGWSLPATKSFIYHNKNFICKATIFYLFNVVMIYSASFFIRTIGARQIKWNYMDEWMHTAVTVWMIIRFSRYNLSA